MDCSEFLTHCLLLDLESNENGELIAIGAVLHDRVFSRSGRFDLHIALAELDAFADQADHVLGHNLLGHDLPLLQTLKPDLQLLHKPVIDTLYLSPLAFPENPYHRLVKDYKLVRDTLNDPVADASLAARVFGDQWQSLQALQATEPRVLLFYHYCLGAGFTQVLEAIGAQPISAAQALTLFQQLTGGRVCRTAFPQVMLHYLPDSERRIALAYGLAWLRVAEGNSVLPPWVRHRFPEVPVLLRQLRDIPCGNSSCDYCRRVHDPVGQLQRYFGFAAFRTEPATASGSSLQQAVVECAMGDRPLLAILPTGGGKSLCYQLPALARYQRRGVLTIVVSPLQALMKDQIDNLCHKTGAPNAAALYGLLTPPERGEVLNGVRLGDIAILYVSPEQLRNRSFREAISQREIGCWVFDEAHCLSKWGHDFRPDYLYAARFIKEFALQQQTMVPPVQCFTATAKPDVRAEIVDYFHRELGHELVVFEGGIERDNLHFEVQAVNRAEKYPRIHAILGERLSAEQGCAVVYCATRRSSEAAAMYLRQQGWAVEAFHAGLDPAAKRHTQENFIAGTTRVICATNAFGMGIDKDDVRLVIHADIPGSLENYLQEAGRAGRDRQEAECVLLYDEQDVETQFKLEAFSELNQRDLAQLLRGLRAARRDRDNEVIITAGELLRSEAVATSFASDERGADTKVRTAIAWLERAGFLERNDNRTQVFQGRPLVKSLEEARTRIQSLRLSQRQQERWLAILELLLNADRDQGFSADELAELTPFRREPEAASDRHGETETQRVLRTLHAMAEAGLIRKSLLLTAFVRYKIANASASLLERVCRLERALLKLLPEAAPDAGDGSWQSLSLRQLNQRLLDEGHESNPETLRNLLHSLTRDGQGLAGQRGSLDLHYQGQDYYQIKLQRDWKALITTAERRQAVAQAALAAILAHIPADAPASADLLVEFAAEDILEALRRDPLLGGQLKDPLAAVDRALLFLHEQRVITLQQGLAVFCQAMTIHLFPEQRSRRYSKSDYEPLSHHYAERVFQVHVINEYARQGLEKIAQALTLVMAYFSEDKKTFIKRYFAGRRELLARATSQQSYQRIVETLHNPIQAAIVAAPEDDNLLILAGPGSGKTRVVVHRCAYLLRVRRVRPQSILILCFNRHAAITLRRRLGELAGDDAHGVTIQTYHGLAMRLTGHFLATRLERAGEAAFDFDALICEAIALLQGHTEVPGLAPDELRDRLLAGYRYILVDEYQDIDSDQYALISAIAGRTLADRDARLAILAVGDDDQNIYQFRGANVAFIRRFQEDYGAQVHYLVENYRSTAHIIAAANQLIGHNRDRMKTEHPIRINRDRETLPPGGPWTRLDPLAQGRVQCLQVADECQQALALVAELRRLGQLHSSLQWSDCAVLAAEWALLHPVRALCEAEGIPVSMAMDPEHLPPPLRIREPIRFLEALQERGDALCRASQLLEQLDGMAANADANPWWQCLRSVLLEWREITGDSELPVKQALELVCESLLEQRRERRFGDGVLLSTVHSAKGLEFNHVFMPDGGWGRNGDREEERRLYYVGMSRARETLCLFERNDQRNPHTRWLDGDYLWRRSVQMVASPAPEMVGRRYAVWGLQDFRLSFAGWKPGHDPIHQRLAALQPGSTLYAQGHGDKVYLRDQTGTVVALLSKSACAAWRKHLNQIESIRVVAVVRWRQQDSEPDYRKRCRVEQWEVPMVEVVHRIQIDQRPHTKVGKTGKIVPMPLS